MKKLMLSIMLAAVCGSLSAQGTSAEERARKHLKAFYVDLHYGISSGILKGAGLNVRFNNGWGASMAGSVFSYNPLGLPGKYADLNIKPTKVVTSYTLSLARDLKISPRFCYGIELGGGYMTYYWKHYVPAGQDGLYSGPSTHFHSACANFRTKLQYHHKSFGLELGLTTNLNPYKTYTAIDLRLLAGILK